MSARPRIAGRDGWDWRRSERLQATDRGQHIGCDPDHRPKAWLSNGTTWLADTGEPLNRAWRGHRIRVEGEGYLRNRIREKLNTWLAGEPSVDALAKVYDFLLEALR